MIQICRNYSPFTKDQAEVSLAPYSPDLTALGHNFSEFTNAEYGGRNRRQLPPSKPLSKVFKLHSVATSFVQ